MKRLLKIVDDSESDSSSSNSSNHPVISKKQKKKNMRVKSSFIEDEAEVSMDENDVSLSGDDDDDVSDEETEADRAMIDNSPVENDGLTQRMLIANNRAIMLDVEKEEIKTIVANAKNRYKHQTNQYKKKKNKTASSSSSSPPSISTNPVNSLFDETTTTTTTTVTPKNNVKEDILPILKWVWNTTFAGVLQDFGVDKWCPRSTLIKETLLHHSGVVFNNISLNYSVLMSMIENISEPRTDEDNNAITNIFPIRHIDALESETGIRMIITVVWKRASGVVSYKRLGTVIEI